MTTDPPASVPPLTAMPPTAPESSQMVAVTEPCAHRKAVPVDLQMTGERVAWWCPGCETQLPADWPAA